MRRGWSCFAAVLLTALAGAGMQAQAQKASTDESKRKVKTRVVPVYPELAHRMSVSGKVKIEVVISPDGRVKSTKVIGGHPLLVNPALDAAKNWRFAPAAEETTQVIEFEFNANGDS
jgi:TonB family protein